MCYFIIPSFPFVRGPQSKYAGAPHGLKKALDGARRATLCLEGVNSNLSRGADIPSRLQSKLKCEIFIWIRFIYLFIFIISICARYEIQIPKRGKNSFIKINSQNCPESFRLRRKRNNNIKV